MKAGIDRTVIVSDCRKRASDARAATGISNRS
jgi:hypothetical protein